MSPQSFQFSLSDASPRAKLLFLGPEDSLPGDIADRLRSLNIEHVSPARLIRPGISRSPDTDTTLLRRWFWTRKPDAGFALTGFPATLLQARVLDEWLEARDESLDAVITLDPATDPVVVEHYRTLGLVPETSALAA